MSTGAWWLSLLVLGIATVSATWAFRRNDAGPPRASAFSAPREALPDPRPETSVIPSVPDSIPPQIRREPTNQAQGSVVPSFQIAWENDGSEPSIKNWDAGRGRYPEGNARYLSDEGLLRALRYQYKAEDRDEQIAALCEKIWEYWVPSHKRGLYGKYCALHPCSPMEARRLGDAAAEVLRDLYRQRDLSIEVRLETAETLNWLGVREGGDLAHQVLDAPLDRASAIEAAKRWSDDWRSDPVHRDLVYRAYALRILSWQEPREYFERLLAAESWAEMQRAIRQALMRIDETMDGKPWLQATSPWTARHPVCTCTNRDK